MAPPPPARSRVKMTPEATLGTALLAYAGLNGLAGLFMLTFPRALWVSIGGADRPDVKAPTPPPASPGP